MYIHVYIARANSLFTGFDGRLAPEIVPGSISTGGLACVSYFRIPDSNYEHRESSSPSLTFSLSFAPLRLSFSLPLHRTPSRLPPRSNFRFVQIHGGSISRDTESRHALRRHTHWGVCVHGVFTRVRRLATGHVAAWSRDDGRPCRAA